MKIVVAIKQVPARDSAPAADSSGVWLDEANLTFEMNEPDAYALEAALQLKEAHGGEVVALSAGPERVQSTIREALAKGADRAVHVVAGEIHKLDALATARLLAAAAAGEQPDLILTGLQSEDMGSGQTGVIVAELLGLAHATIIMAVDVDGGGLRVKRELEAGWFQYVTLPLPVVLAIQSGINKLRYATLMGIKRAKAKEIRRIEARQAGACPAGGLRLKRLEEPRRTKQTRFFSGSPAEQAAQLVEKLKFEARVL